ncbi:PP2C family protein-serine/threonine phosphatase [Streptomyces sp. LHD-70]|uniref:PP2C family protein-serine/threonine phosphatase n=1 Tax=Streptomyces sp. LHD-70 TaxID=3072140 RepID=UPI0035BE30D8
METAARYLPSSARAGVGGDWYDVIPLSGARIAFVIGDVVGRGLYASAIMGRLRTAVRTLADIDLMPDKLLNRAHLRDRPAGRLGPGRPGLQHRAHGQRTRDERDPLWTTARQSADDPPVHADLRGRGRLQLSDAGSPRSCVSPTSRQGIQLWIISLKNSATGTGSNPS